MLRRRDIRAPTAASKYGHLLLLFADGHYVQLVLVFCSEGGMLLLHEAEKLVAADLFHESLAHQLLVLSLEPSLGLQQAQGGTKECSRHGW